MINMTVKELYEKLKEEIEEGHGDIPVMIHDNINDGDFSYTEVNALESTTYHSELSYWGYWPEHLEIGRY